MQTEFLNIILMSFEYKGLMSLSELPGHRVLECEGDFNYE
jgi:hypothetical protein